MPGALEREAVTLHPQKHSKWQAGFKYIRDQCGKFVSCNLDIGCTIMMLSIYIYY
jgi:hypothetical protein